MKSNTATATTAEPVNIKLLDVDKFIIGHQVSAVTSTFVRQPSSTTFHPDGLYSEEIFGEIGSPARLTTFGYIKLGCEVLHPIVHQNITRLKQLYAHIMTGRSYARFDETEKDFVNAAPTEEGAGTGYLFFMEHFRKIVFKPSTSMARNNKIKFIEKYREILTMDKILLLPAGFRDVKVDDTRNATEVINEHYSALINLSRNITPANKNNPIFNDIRSVTQKKVNEIYEYLLEILQGKTGFIQKKVNSRAIAGGTRNVISAAKMSPKHPSDPQHIKHDETGVPLFEGVKAFEPFIGFYLRTLFLNDVFDGADSQMSVIDPKTYNTVYVPLSESEKTKYLSRDGMASLINEFEDPRVQTMPVSITSEGKRYHLFLVYDDGKSIYIVRNADEFMTQMQEAGEKVNRKYLRPMTYMEMFYIATNEATRDKHVFITRYPITYVESVYPSRVHLLSTTNSRCVNLRYHYNPAVALQLPEYPVAGSSLIDSAMIHPSKLRGLGADHDGDMVDVVGIWDVKANRQIDAHLSSPGSIVSSDLALASGGSSPIIDLTIYNFTNGSYKKTA